MNWELNKNNQSLVQKRHFTISANTKVVISKNPFYLSKELIKSQSNLTSSFNLPSQNYSTNTINPVVCYENADTLKLQIIKENRKKSGIYRWTNLINGKSYIGSSVNLERRFKFYYNISSLETQIKKGRSNISLALLKQGYSAFSLEILEYCEPSVAISREQHFLDLLQPEYNILKYAGSSLGRKHTEDTIAKLKALSLTSEQKAKRLEHLKILNANPEFKAKRLEQLNLLIQILNLQLSV